jgi:hypothetical protein
VSERKSEDREAVEEVEEKRENGLRLRVRVGMGVRRRPRSRLERTMLSNRVMEARVGVIAAEEEVDTGAGVVRSHSEMNSLKPVIVVSLAMSKTGRPMLTLCLPKYSNIVSMFVWQASQKVIHVEAVDHPILPLFRRRSLHILPIGVEQAGETPCKRRAHLLRIESRWTDDEQFVCTPAVYGGATS